MMRILFSVLFTVLLASASYAAPGDKIYYEDFSAYGEGELPAGWIGGDKLGIIEVNKKKILRDLANGSYDITTKKIDLPNSFKANIIMKHSFYNKYREYDFNDSDRANRRIENSVNINFGEYGINIGDGAIIAGMKDKWPNWKELETVAPDKTFSLSLEKKGPVCKVYVNNTKMFVGRFPDVKMNNIRFASNSKFEIHSIVVEEL